MNILVLSEAIQLNVKHENKIDERTLSLNSVRVDDFLDNSDSSSYDSGFISLTEKLNIKLMTLNKLALHTFTDRCVKMLC